MRYTKILLIIFLFFLTSVTLASATDLDPDNGFQFKEIIWDQGWIWILMLIMGVAAIFDFIKGIIADARGGSYEEEEKRTKPSYEIIVRRRIE
jgi:phosphatidylglycerophosphate synthase